MNKPVFHDPEAVVELRKELAKHHFTAPAREPDWSTVLKPIQLPFLPDSESAKKEMATYLSRVWSLRLADYETLEELILFDFVKLPEIARYLVSFGNEEGLRLCALFEAFLKMATQGNSMFPGKPTELAMQVRDSLRRMVDAQSRTGEQSSIQPEFRLLAELLVGDDVELRNGRLKYTLKSGTNFFEASDPNRIALWEYQFEEGKFDSEIREKIKFQEQSKSVQDNQELFRDWNCLKNEYPQYCSRGAIYHRGSRRWRLPSGVVIANDQTLLRFFDAFDFFCWKWFLEGMKNDEPLLERFRYEITPYGTQIFIPGYWSFDPARDISWKQLVRLHRARGVRPFGAKSATNDRERAKEDKELIKAEREGRQRKLRGDAFYLFVKREAGLPEQLDNENVRGKLRQAKKRQVL